MTKEASQEKSEAQQSTMSIHRKKMPEKKRPLQATQVVPHTQGMHVGMNGEKGRSRRVQTGEGENGGKKQKCSLLYM